MHKNRGKQQQQRGHKRRIKIANMKKRRNPNAVKPNPGEKYINTYLGISNE